MLIDADSVNPVICLWTVLNQMSERNLAVSRYLKCEIIDMNGGRVFCTAPSIGERSVRGCSGSIGCYKAEAQVVDRIVVLLYMQKANLLARFCQRLISNA